MATTALTAAELALIRGKSAIEDVTVHITPLTTVQSGTITAVPTKTPYVDITWDGSTSGIVTGQLVKIANGTTLKTWAVVRKAPSGATLYINATPLGSPGYTTRIENAIVVGDTVTVYNHHPLWGMYSRIAQRTFYKQWDVAYSGQNSTPPPVANAGAWQAGKLGNRSYVVMTLPRLGVNTSFAMAGTLSTYAWSLPAGVTLREGYATSDSVIQVEATPGYHLVSLTVTDSGARTHTAYVWLFVSDGTTGTSLSERYSLSSDISINQERGGLVANLTVTGASLEDVIYPGAGILIKERPYFGTRQQLDAGQSIDTFVGYIAEASYTYTEGRISQAQLTIESPLVYANRIPQPEQSLEEKSSPANWTQCTSVLSNPLGAAYYSAKWHTPALLDMHDFDGAGLASPRRKFIQWPTKTLGEALQSGAALFACRIGSAADGTTVLRRYPLYMDNTDRNALASVLTWTTSDLRRPLGYNKRLLQQYAEGFTGAFAYNGSKTKAWAAIKRWGQGIGQTELANFTVGMAEGVDRVKAVVGHYLAEQNADISEITLALTANQDVVDPAYLLWNRLTIDSSYDPAGVGFNAERALPLRVDRAYSYDESAGWLKETTISLQPETYGQPGEEYVIGNVKASTVNGWAISTPVPYTPNRDETFGALGVALALSRDGDLAITYNYLATNVDWTDISLGFTGSVCDFDWDYNSNYFSSGGDPSQELAVFVLSASSTTLYVYRIIDVKTLEIEQLTTFTMADATTQTEARIACSESTADFVVVHWRTRSSCVVRRSTDNGATWGSDVTVGTTYTDTANDNAPIGLAVEGANQLAVGWDGTNYRVYIATATGGAFAVLGSSPNFTVPVRGIRNGSGDGYAYAYSPNTGGSGLALDSIVTRDTLGYPNVSDWLSPLDTVNLDSTGGNPSNCIKGTAATYFFGVGLYIMVLFDTPQTLENVLFDAYIDCPSCGDFGEWQINFYTAAWTGAGRYVGVGAGELNNDATWYSIDANADKTSGGSFPVSNVNAIGLLIDMIDGSGSGTVDFRFDNIEMVTTNPIEWLFHVNFYLGGYDLANITDVSTGSLTVELPTTDHSSGNPKDCVKATGSYAPFQELEIKIDLGQEFTVNDVILDAYVDNSVSGGPGYQLLEVKFSDSTDTPLSGTYYAQATNGAVWYNYDMGIVAYGTGSFPISGCQYVYVRLAWSYIPYSGTIDLRIDNIKITVEPEGGSGGSGGGVQRIATYTGTPSWTDITPAGGDVPEASYQLAVDRADSATIHLFTDSPKWYSAPDRGTTWTTEESSTTKRTAIAQGLAKMFGDTLAAMTLTLDDTTFDDITGDLDGIWAVKPTVKKVDAL